jgi:hypothetical protein
MDTSNYNLSSTIDYCLVVNNTLPVRIKTKSDRYKETFLDKHLPYVYIVGFSKLRKYYLGVRVRKGCHPSEFGKVYRSSSKKVKELWEEYGEPDLQIILRAFESASDAIEHEVKCLRYLDVLNNDNWLNENIAGAISPAKCVEGTIKRNLLYGSPRKNSEMQRRLGFLGNWKRYKILKPMRMKLLTYEKSA